MKKMKMAIVALLAVLVLLVAALMGLMIVNNRNFIIDGKAYPKDADYLDLRGEVITLQHYETVRQVFPDAEILWDVPLAGGAVSCDSREAAVTDLQELVDLLNYFPNLETLDITGCSDISALPALHQAKPELKLRFSLTVDGNTYTQDSTELILSDVGETELILLRSMNELESVAVNEGGDTSGIPALKEYCLEQGIETRAVLTGQLSGKELTLENATEDQTRLLMLASDLETLHFVEPEAEAQTLLTLRKVLPETKITWEKTVMGLTFHSDAAEIDLTPVVSLEEGQKLGDRTAYQIGMEQPVMGKQEEVPSTVKILEEYPLPNRLETTHQLIAEMDAFMDYFPKAEKLVMCGAFLDDEAMAQYREARRGEYKVVWTVMCGPVATRTDATFFMPTKYHVRIESFVDWHAYNLRYCEDIVSIDLGHSSITDLEFVKYMPNLTYLDVALTFVQDLTPLTTCQNLVFLVLHTIDREIDYTPLLECTALEDLNIGANRKSDVTPLLRMKQLKNLWMPSCGEENTRKAKGITTDVNICFSGNSNSGWRSLPNYFKMRDAMLMFYMS